MVADDGYDALRLIKSSLGSLGVLLSMLPVLGSLLEPIYAMRGTVSQS
jgi:hypothetical protein